MRYLDSGNRSADETVYEWLKPRLANATYFGCQTGYFSADGLFAFESDLRRLLDAGGECHFVLGSNEDSLALNDIEYLLDMIDSYPASASLVVVGAPDVLMHSKVYYVEHEEGMRSALVGSANLTSRGLAANIETALAIDQGDPGAPLDEIKQGIEDWRSGSRPNAVAVDRSNLNSLVAARAVGAPRRTRPTTSTRAQRAHNKLFPPLGRILRLPARPRPRRAPTTRALGQSSPTSLAPKPGSPFRIVKRLSGEDTKGFRGASGTAYIALPVALAGLIPLKPAGKNKEPRIDVEIEATLSPSPSLVVTSGAATTNITHVGAGTTRRSHRDLRLNILKVICQGLVYTAQQNGSPLPQRGDPVWIDIHPAGVVKLHFVTTEPERSRLLALCTEGGRWGWIP